MIVGQLLDFALDPGLRGIFNENTRPLQYIGMKLGLAGAIAADRVDVETGADHVVGQYGGELLVGGAGRDDHPVRYRVVIGGVGRG